MKKLFIIVPTFLLSGCLTFGTPVRHKFPEVPAELLKTCPDLQLVQDTDKLSDILKVVNDNYFKYHECKLSTDTWIEWYKINKDIFNK